MAAWTAQDELHIPEQPPLPRFAALQQTQHFPTSFDTFQVRFPGLLQGPSECPGRLPQQPCRAGDGVSTGVPSEPSSLNGSSGSSFGNRLENRLDNSGKQSSDSGNKSSPSDWGSCDSIEEEGGRSPTVFLARVSNLPAHTGESDILHALQASNFALSVDFCSILQEPQGGMRQALIRFTERTAALAFSVAWEGSYRFGVVPPWPPIRVEVQGVISSHSVTAHGVTRRRERRLRGGSDNQVKAQEERFQQSSSSSMSGSTFIHHAPHQQSSSSSMSGSMSHYRPREMLPSSEEAAGEATQTDRFGVPAEMGAATEEEDDEEQSVQDCADAGQRQKGTGTARTKTRGGQGTKHTMPPDEIRAKGVTALMVRNIPYDLLQSDMLKQLDNSGFADMYDFCYLPCAFATRDNHGYAFINFISPDGAASLVEKWDRRPLFDSVKPLFISPASQQGLDALLKLCEKKKLYRIRNPRYQPFVRKSSGQTPTAATASKDQDQGSSEARGSRSAPDQSKGRSAQLR